MELGHRVVAVDQSSEMLACVRGTETVLADIETLHLGRRFPAVLLLSHLVNTADEAQRATFLRACRRHVTEDGVVLVQRLDPAATWEEDKPTERDGLTTVLRDVRLQGELVSAVVEYEIDGRRWSHAFTDRVLSDEEIAADLARADLQLRSWLDEQRCWLAAAPR